MQIFNVFDLFDLSSYKILRIDISGKFDILANHCKIPSYKYEENIKVPLIPNRNYTMYDSSRISDIGIPIISINLSRNDGLKYEEKEIYKCSLKPEQIDSSLIPHWARCSNIDSCNYYIITNVTIKEVFYRKYTKRTRRINAREFPLIGSAGFLNGSLYISSTNEAETLKHFVIYTAEKYIF